MNQSIEMQQMKSQMKSLTDEQFHRWLFDLFFWLIVDFIICWFDYLIIWLLGGLISWLFGGLTCWLFVYLIIF